MLWIQNEIFSYNNFIDFNKSNYLFNIKKLCNREIKKKSLEIFFLILKIKINFTIPNKKMNFIKIFVKMKLEPFFFIKIFNHINIFFPFKFKLSDF
jgi:hypothetical protein